MPHSVAHSKSVATLANTSSKIAEGCLRACGRDAIRCPGRVADLIGRRPWFAFLPHHRDGEAGRAGEVPPLVIGSTIGGSACVSVD